MIDQRDMLETYLEEITPIFRELFGIAHAITDQYEAAEYVLQRTIQKGFLLKGRNRMSFRERMRHLTIRLAKEYVKQNGRPEDGEGTWSGFDTVNVQDNAFLNEAVREPLLMRRILMLKFGADMHSYDIAPIIGMDKARVRAYLQQFEARVERKVRQKDSAFEKMARYAALQDLRRIDGDVPDTAATFRQLQADMVETVGTSETGRIRRIIGVAVMTFAILLCVALFWLFAVLMENPPAANIQTETSEISLQQE